MRRLFETVACIALMAVFGRALHWLMFNVTAPFWVGVPLGASLFSALIWIAWKISPESFDDRRPEEERRRIGWKIYIAAAFVLMSALFAYVLFNGDRFGDGIFCGMIGVMLPVAVIDYFRKRVRCEPAGQASVQEGSLQHSLRSTKRS